jgi:hypothetical protein
MFNEELIELQRKKVFREPNYVRLSRPCSIQDGIISLSTDQKINFRKLFQNIQSEITFFIPASGAGSRMFSLFYQFLENPEKTAEEIQDFIDSLEKYAFAKLVDFNYLKSLSDRNLIEHLLEELELDNLPKGLIPFHITQSGFLTAFEEHLAQGCKLNSEVKFHFTIQKEFEDQFKQIANQTSEAFNINTSINYSEQDPVTNSIAFEFNGTPLLENDALVTRPSGHGALLQSLNSIHSPIVLIKNIDNVQHIEKSSLSNEYWEILSGLLIDLKNKLAELFSSPSNELFTSINKEFELFDETIAPKTPEEILQLINKPVRVCGMVKNEGQPGGGPFWIEKNGIISKQIVEKAQISNDQVQINILNNSTHFNPVMIALSPVSVQGEKFDLTNFVDEEAYFIVNKTQGEKEIKYLERPGLWNGSMADWITVFVEIPSEIFSPVKSVTDLLNDAHQPKR